MRIVPIGMFRMQATSAKLTRFKAPQFVRSPRFVPAALFVAAFAGVVAFANRDRLAGSESGAELPPHSATGAVAMAPSAAKTANTAGVQSDSRHAAPVVAAAAAAPSSPPVPSATPHRAEPTAEQLQAISELKQKLSAPTEDGAPMEEREQRGDAIREAARIAGPQAVEALIAALRNDSDRRNRILAVEGLRKAAVAGDADGSIREALREASTSSDEIIAAHAREAYDVLPVAR